MIGVVSYGIGFAVIKNMLSGGNLLKGLAIGILDWLMQSLFSKQVPYYYRSGVS
jgi:hypothetical protein